MKILTCTNDKCKNVFALTETDVLGLVRKEGEDYVILTTEMITVQCPLCSTPQVLNSGDLIGEYVVTSHDSK